MSGVLENVMLSELTWSAGLLAVLPIVAKVALEKLGNALLSEKPRRSEQELHHRIFAELQRTQADGSVFAQQLKRSLSEELVPSAKTHEDAMRVLHLKEWRKLTRMTKSVTGIVEIVADELGVPRVVWSERWAGFLWGGPFVAFLKLFALYWVGFVTTLAWLSIYVLAWKIDGLGMSVLTFLLSPVAILLSGSIAVLGFAFSVRSLDAWSACRYSKKLVEADLLVDIVEPAVARQPTLKVVSRKLAVRQARVVDGTIAAVLTRGQGAIRNRPART